MSVDQDREFIKALIAKDNQAWEQMSRCIENWLINASKRHFIPDSDINDLRQEIIEKLFENNFKKLQQFSFRCRLSSWIGSVVNYHLFDYYTTEIRRERREAGFLEIKREIITENETDDRIIEKVDYHTKIQEALNSLNPGELQVVKMTYWEGLMPHDIAKITGERTSTVTSKLTRARKKLRETILEIADKGEKAI